MKINLFTILVLAVALVLCICKFSSLSEKNVVSVLTETRQHDVVETLEQTPTSLSTETDKVLQPENETTEAIQQSEEHNIKDTSKIMQSYNNSKIIYIDAGHQAKGDSMLELIYPGGTDKKAKATSGTHGVATGKNEYQLNLEVALKLQKKLEANGYTVIMSRTQNDVNISNIDRAKQGNDSNADAVIRIHADGSENSNITGYSVLIPSAVHNSNQNVISQSKQLGNCMIIAMQNNLGGNSRGVIERSDLTGFNWSEVPVVLIEMGFMTNPEEDTKMSQDDYQNKIVQSLSDGINSYFSE